MPEEASATSGQVEVKRGRQRSPNYPAISLREAVERVGKLYAADKKAGSPVDAALIHMGFSGRNGKAMTVLSALRKFGLVEDAGGRIAPTQRAIEILVLPEGDDRRTVALHDSALSPEIFRELYEQYRESGIPSDATLRSELIAYKGFNPNAVGDFVADFRDSLDFAGLTTDGALSFGQNEEPVREMMSTTVKTPESLPPAATLVPNPAPGGLRQDVFSLAEGPVTIQWPASLSPDSYQDLGDWLDIVKRKIGRSVKAMDGAQ
jgi:hypothetical protein